MKLFQRFGVEQNGIGSHHHDDMRSFSGAPPHRRDGEVITTPLTRNGALDPPSPSLLFPKQGENMPFHHPALHQSLIISSHPITQLLRPPCPVHFRRRGVHLIHRLLQILCHLIPSLLYSYARLMDYTWLQRFRPGLPLTDKDEDSRQSH